MLNLNLRAVSAACVLVLAAGVAVASTAGAARAPAADPGRAAMAQAVPSGNVIFFHPDGTGLNHWNAHRMYFHGLDGIANKDRLPQMAVYRGHMHNLTNGTSHAGATTHAFGYKVDAFGSFGMDGDGNANPPTNRAIRSLSGFSGSVMREAANAGMPVGVVNDGHIGEPGTGAFLAEVGNRDNWQEITRQMILGRPGMNDTAPWVIMGGGEADALPQGTTTVHRNVNEERRAPVNSRQSLRTDDLNLVAAWNAMGSGNLSNDPTQRDDFIVLRTRAEFERLKQALQAHPRYAPRVLGLFAFQDTFNDRNEQDLINRGFVRAGMAAGTTGAGPQKQSRLVLWGDHDAAEPGFNPPTFAEMTEVALTILSRAAAQRPQAAQRRFFLVAEQESIDNFGNNTNAIGMLHAMQDTDRAIGSAGLFAPQRAHPYRHRRRQRRRWHDGGLKPSRGHHAADQHLAGRARARQRGHRGHQPVGSHPSGRHRPRCRSGEQLPRRRRGPAVADVCHRAGSVWQPDAVWHRLAGHVRLPRRRVVARRRPQRRPAQQPLQRPL